MSEWPADILHAVWWLISVIFWPYPWIVLSLAAALIAAGIALWLFAGARLTGRERP